MRRTLPTLAVCTALLDRPDASHWAYDLHNRTGVARGTINKILRNMLRSGWLSDSWEVATREPRPLRHYYRLTELGRLQIVKMVECQRRQHPRLDNIEFKVAG